MILLAALGIALIVSLATGGRLVNLGLVHLRHGYLIFVALGVQILVFSPAWQARVRVDNLSEALYSVSLLLLLAAVWLNRRVPGIAVLGLGLLLNALVILANGGRMPATLEALQTAGIVESQAAFEAARVTNSALIDANTPLWFLGDVFAIPAWFPLANVFSIGDVLIGIGGILFIVHHTRSQPAD